MTRSTMLHVRVDDEIKAQASEALAAMGLSVSDAVLRISGHGGQRFSLKADTISS